MGRGIIWITEVHSQPLIGYDAAATAPPEVVIQVVPGNKEAARLARKPWFVPALLALNCPGVRNRSCVHNHHALPSADGIGGDPRCLRGEA